MRVILSLALLAMPLWSGCAASPQDDLGDAAAACDLAKVKAAIAAKSDVNAQPDGPTPLIYAAANGCTDVTKALIAAGANVNAKTSDASLPGTRGESALMRAAQEYPEIVKVLIAAGADVNIKGEGGQTALTIAARFGQVETARQLITAGADVNAREADGRSPLAEATGHMKDSAFGTPQDHVAVADLLRQHGAHEN